MSIYSIVRAHATKIKLLTREDYKKLAKAEDARTLIRLLRDTAYGDVIEKLPTEEPDYDVFKRVLYEKYLNLYKTLEMGVSEDYRSFLREYILGKLELENIRYSIRMIITNRRITVRNILPVRVYISPSSLVKVKNLRMLITLLERAYPSVKRAYTLYRKLMIPDILECSIEADYYDRVEKEISRRDLDLEGKLLDEEKGLRWLKWAINFKLRGNLKPEDYLPLLNRFSSTLSSKLTPSIIGVDVGTLVREISSIRKYRSLSLTLGSLISRREYMLIDVVLASVLHKVLKEYIVKEPLNVVYVTSILLLVEIEVRNILTIYLSKKVGLDWREILPYLIV